MCYYAEKHRRECKAQQEQFNKIKRLEYEIARLKKGLRKRNEISILKT